MPPSQLSAGPGGAGFDLFATLPDPFENLGVSGGESHHESCARLSVGNIEDCVDEAGAGARWQVSCFHSQRCSHHVGLGPDIGFDEDSTVVLDRDVLEVGVHRGAMGRLGRDSRMLWRAKETLRRPGNRGRTRGSAWGLGRCSVRLLSAGRLRPRRCSSTIIWTVDRTRCRVYKVNLHSRIAM